MVFTQQGAVSGQLKAGSIHVDSKMIEKKKVRNFHDLIVWQKAMDIVVNIYKITKSFPREEIYGLTSQIRRTAVSIPSNIAEGQARSSLED